MKKYFLFFLATSFLLVGCSKDDDDNGIPKGPGNVQLENEVNEFIWKGLNYWYFWQADQELLADDRFANTDEFYTFLNNYSSSEDLFDDLIYQPGVVDDFSWYIEDVEEQLNSFRGISKTYGIKFPRSLIRPNPNTDDVVIFIAYVVPGSPADQAGLKRGDIINRVDGETMNTGNSSIINKVFSEESITLGLAEIVNGEVQSVGDEIPLTAVTLTENPVHYYEIIEEGGKKIGYLVYNGFRSTFNGELNDVFGVFKNENIDEFVLDLRYNGGGSVLSSALLASMINGNITAQNDAFARLQYNEKRDSENGFTYPFFDEVFLYDKTTSDFIGDEPANRLTTLSRLYVLVSNRTASASEMIINGLRPYMPVTLVGETTVGKNEGSITVVDAPGSGNSDPYTDVDNRNPNHTVGMQPIVFQVFNSRYESDYTFGFEPDILVEEFRFVADIKPFGDPDEALLRVALDDILGVSAKKAFMRPDQNLMRKEGEIKLPRFTDEMYLTDRGHQRDHQDFP